MSVSLYRAGNTHEIDGVKCEMKVFDEYLFASNLDAGWNLTPEECYETEEQESNEETATEALEKKEAKKNVGFTDEEIRTLAKAKGIPHWHNKNIDKLRKEVDEWQQEF